ncbi:hypothetical protein AXG93_4666s1350 [Marchantia polymorpha subsp. ruderalis]|uniref:Uncharacterized protein n=1 Tax=Marchantia polymorpha subsp. ruderalis TaxID=1480154 RepID=A0A176W263_MARPO|nr:hypothetical protein AXG93_4666s1350 [Marchantia polymorpha subsp. ruderalis]
MGDARLQRLPRSRPGRRVDTRCPSSKPREQQQASKCRAMKSRIDKSWCFDESLVSHYDAIEMPDVLLLSEVDAESFDDDDDDEYLSTTVCLPGVPSKHPDDRAR